VAQQLAQNPKLVDDPDFGQRIRVSINTWRHTRKFAASFSSIPSASCLPRNGSARDSVAKSNTTRGTAEPHRAFEATMREPTE